VDGYDLEPGAAPPNHSGGSQPDWSPFTSQVQFETADFLFKKVEMSHADTDTLMRLWATTTPDGCAPFSNHQEMLSTVDAIDAGDIPWQSFSAKYSGTAPPTNPPDWMLKEYTVYFRDPLAVVRSMVSNPEFKNQFDHAPYREFEDGVRRRTDLMSGDWAWEHAVCL
jgi:Plavaka transposase